MKKTITISFLSFLVCTMVFAAPAYDIFYVDAANLSPVPPFDTWAKAAPTIQAAVDAASAKDHIIVTNGVYNVGRRITPGYMLSNRVLITKDITVRSVNGPEGTIILGAEAPGGGTGTGAVRCVYMTAGKLYGFTISNGFTLSRLSDFQDGLGGGIRLTNGCVVTNCIISGNAAGSSGGGMYFRNSGVVSDCTISGNSGFWGGGTSGGIVNNCIVSGNSAAVGGGTYQCIVSNCTISGNLSSGYGGGTYGGTINDCAISENRADYGGGIYAGKVNNCTISGNSASECGGGTYIGTINDCAINGNSAEDGGGTCQSFVNNCTISGNSASECGGGTYIGTINDCAINGNSAEDGGGTCQSFVNNCTISGNSASECGGGTFESKVNDCAINGNSAGENGGGTYDSKANNCTISENSAEKGGGVYCSDDITLTNCLIYGTNIATFGAGAYLENGGELINCTIAGNNASSYGGGICTSNGGTVINTIIYDNLALYGNDNWLNYDSGAAFTYCCTTPTNNLPVGNKCIPDDPMFIAAGSDYRLQEGSPCIDAGFNMAWMTDATDLDGNPRIHDGKVDMGCYEFVPEPSAFGAVISYLLLVLGIGRKFKSNI